MMSPDRPETKLQSWKRHLRHYKGSSDAIQQMKRCQIFSVCQLMSIISFLMKQEEFAS